MTPAVEEPMRAATDAMPVRERAPSGRALAGLFLLLLAVYLATTPGHFQVTDHTAVYQTTAALVERGELAIEPIPLAAPCLNGRHCSVYGLGQPLVSVPLYLLGRAAEQVLPAHLAPYFTAPGSGWYGGNVRMWFVALLNVLLTPLAAVLVARLGAALAFGPWRALGLALVYGLGTLAWTYARDYAQHPLESLCILAAVYVLVAHRARPRPWHALLAGLLLAFGVLTRPNVAIVAPGLGLYLAAIAWPAEQSGALIRRLPWTHLLAFGLPLAATLLALGLLNYTLYGDATTLGYRYFVRGQEYGSVVAANPLGPLWHLLVGPARGLLLYAPPVLLGLLGWPLLFRRDRATALLFLYVVASYLAFYAMLRNWSGGWGWGPRFLLPVIPYLVLAAGCFVTTRRRAIALGVLAGVGALVQLAGIVVWFSFLGASWAERNFLPAGGWVVPDPPPWPMFYGYLVELRAPDLWLRAVAEQYGLGVALGTTALLALLALQGVSLLRRDLTPPSPRGKGGWRRGGDAVSCFAPRWEGAGERGVRRGRPGAS